MVGQRPDVAQQFARQPGRHEYRVQNGRIDQSARVQSRLVDLRVILGNFAVLPRSLETGNRMLLLLRLLLQLLIMLRQCVMLLQLLLPRLTLLLLCFTDPARAK